MDYTSFRDNLRALMDSRGFTINGLGAEIGVSAATISRYLSGKRAPDLPYVIKISTFFNVSIDWLLGINGDKFDVMPKEIQDVAYLYSVSTPDDRRVIQAVLSKYREE